MGRVILLEFNELTPALMDRFIAAGYLPAFKRLRDESVTAVTDAGEDPPYLEPWIQWVTVHTGLSYAEHGVFDLGDGPKLRAPRVWDMVSDAGLPVWVCGSMNAAVQSPAIRGHILPDPWATGVKSLPEREFAPFYDFVRAYVQEYTRDKPPIGRGDYVRFLRFMVSHGLSVRTVSAIMRQLIGEKGGRLGKWRRAVLLDAMMWDVFRHDYKTLQPTLATFFLNSTAHFQHYYWRNLDPGSFALGPDAAQVNDQGEAILFGYRRMDAIVADCLEMAGPDTTVILCTALGQQPLTKYDEEGGRMLFKPVDPAELLRFAGIGDMVDVMPVMAEEFRLHFADPAAANEAESKLSALRMADGRPVMRVRSTGPGELYCGCEIGATPGADATVISGASNISRSFASLFYPIDAGVKSGMHHRDGLLWIRLPDRSACHIDRRVSLQEIAPTLLELCGVPAPIAFAMPPIPELSSGAGASRRAA